MNAYRELDFRLLEPEKVAGKFEILPADMSREIRNTVFQRFTDKGKYGYSVKEPNIKTDIGPYSTDEVGDVFLALSPVLPEEFVYLFSMANSNVVKIRYVDFATNSWSFWQPGAHDLYIVNPAMTFLLFVDHEEIVVRADWPMEDAA